LLLLLLLEPLLEALARGGRRARSRFRFFRALPKPAVLHAFRFSEHVLLFFLQHLERRVL